MTALFEVSAADVACTSDDYYTPRWIFDAAGIVFDMDVAAPVDPARRICPAMRYLTPVEDGLTLPWEGLVWMNPPYSNTKPWAARFAEHGHGIALLPVFKRAGWLSVLLPHADALALISVDFIAPNGMKRELPNAMILIGCGQTAVQSVGRVAMADPTVRGAYHVRPVTT